MKILVPLINGFEEIEAITTIDILRRAGIEVVTAGLAGTMIKGGQGVQVMVDKRLDDVAKDSLDGIVLPGGPGFEGLGRSEKIIDIISYLENRGKLVAAICAAPSILAKMGLLENRAATIYPGMEKVLPKPRNGKVVIDKNIITSPGPGTAIDFALKIVEHLKGSQAVEKLRRNLVW